MYLKEDGFQSQRTCKQYASYILSYFWNHFSPSFQRKVATWLPETHTDCKNKPNKPSYSHRHINKCILEPQWKTKNYKKELKASEKSLLKKKLLAEIVLCTYKAK